MSAWAVRCKYFALIGVGQNTGSVICSMRCRKSACLFKCKLTSASSSNIEMFLGTFFRVLRISGALKGKDFIYVEGGLVKTARRGGVFEVQEIGIVKRPGVAVGLNAIMESKKNVFITLPNGEVVKKHKNCIIMFTSNDEYDGTANLNQSVLDRLSHVVYFKNPSESTMAMRVKDVVTDWCLGDDLLNEMATRIDEISKFLRENDISDGVCGQRSLNNWAMEIMVKCAINGISNLNDFNRDLNLRNQILRQTCQNTVLNKVSQVAEDIEAVAAGCIDSVYGYLPVRI